MNKGLIILFLGLLASQALADDVSVGDAIKVLTVHDVSVKIETPDGSKLFSKSGAFPSTLLPGSQIAPEHTLQVTLGVQADGKDYKPQQVFLAFTHKKTGVSAYATGKTKNGVYALAATVSLIEKQIGQLAGEYQVSLLVGDSKVAEGVNWVLGNVELVLPSSADIPSVRTAFAQPVNNVKPTITHLFRQPDKRPPAMVSLVFTAIMFVPLVAVLGYVALVMGVNFNGWPKDATTGLFCLGFHGLIAAMLGLCMLFWLRWNLAQTLPVALGLGGVLVLVGHKALSGLATERLSREVKKD